MNSRMSIFRQNDASATPKKQLPHGLPSGNDKHLNDESSVSEVSEESESYTSSSANTVRKPPGRQDIEFEKWCTKCFKDGRRPGEENFPILHEVMSSDETVKSSSVILQQSREAWRTCNQSAWLMLHFGGLCQVWGVVISWWGNCCAEHVKLFAALDEEGEYWNLITGTETHVFPTFDRVTRIDFNRVPTTHMRIDMRGGQPDFLSKRFFFGIRRIDAVGCRANIHQLSWQPPERTVVEKGLRRLDRANVTAQVNHQGLQKKLYMPGEALEEAHAMCKEGKIPSWSLTMESGIMERLQVWPGTKERTRMQIPSRHRWTAQDPAHPAYWMSPRERVKRQYRELMQQLHEQQSDDETIKEDDGFEIWEECRFWEQDSKTWSPSSTRPSSAQITRPASAQVSRPSSAMRGQKSSISRASTRPTTADTSRAGSRPSTPVLYGSRGSVRPSGRPSSSNVYAHRFGDRPSSAGSVRPGSAPLRERGSVREE
eukprot:gnl/MRDRNA2_/MRDRNA2_95823_c0_seq1.p1 gnl/MRDRNA2_/MRDRNA2_95823_c0~~gnl/MRDRNA2_/MRDRNA2_95823_c0_seq1.p1  ORF type:complete len:485 (+),score=55.04 gnl/MRDRNA2_/MRDRNA2_95823_c0_seq1:212-1666(+)